jgi:hypothetical protein
VLSMTFGRDPAGQLSAQTIGSTSQNFGYNAKGQLGSVGSTTYGTDAANNPITVGTATQTFDAAGQLCWSLLINTSHQILRDGPSYQPHK